MGAAQSPDWRAPEWHAQELARLKVNHPGFRTGECYLIPIQDALQKLSPKSSRSELKAFASRYRLCMVSFAPKRSTAAIYTDLVAAAAGAQVEYKWTADTVPMDVAFNDLTALSPRAEMVTFARRYQLPLKEDQHPIHMYTELIHLVYR